MSPGVQPALDPLCGVVAAPRASGMQRQLRRAMRWTRTLELRLDWLENAGERQRFLAWLRRFPAAGALTLIATCRRRPAGGRFAGSLPAQRQILAAAVAAGCRWYDVEVESLQAGMPYPPLEQGQPIVSLHRFDRQRVPPERWLRQLAQYRGAIPKLAVACQSLREAMQLLMLAQRERAIVVPMGEAALPLRLLAVGYGSRLTYAHAGVPTAPGQLSLEEVVATYPIRRVNTRTRVFGVVGYPVAHSLSPLVHNRAFAAGGIDAIYLPFPVVRLEDFLALVDRLPFGGFSVTIPHKQAIVRHLDWADPLARRVGAVNTVVVRGSKRLGYNTDYGAVLSALQGAVRLPGARVLLLGGGGAARAAAFALADAGAQVCIWARRPEQASKLARAVGGVTVSRAALARTDFDLIVNATPVGMVPHTAQSPLRARELRAPVVFDMVYRPAQTRLLRMARRKGARTVGGLRMFVAQAAAQWELWTGQPAPVRLMWQVARAAVERS